MIRLSNGFELEFLTASGALAFDGRGWFWEWPFRWLGLLDPHAFTIVVKTLTLKPRQGNLRWYKPWGCVRLIPGGTVNAVGLTNPGIDWWIRTCLPRMQRMGYHPIVSVYPETEAEAAEFASKLKPLSIVGIELNASCPNTGHLTDKVDAVVRMASALQNAEHPLIVKLSYDQPYVEIAQGLEGIAEAVHAINAVPWKTVFPNQKSPLESLGGGGVSGEPIRAFAREAVANLVQKTRLPIIAGGGIYTLKDVEEFEALGASAFSLGTLFLRHPTMPNRIVKAWRKRKRKEQVLHPEVKDS